MIYYNVAVVSDAFEDGGHEILHGCLVVWVGIVVHAVGYDGADGHCSVAHEASEALERSRFHFIVGHLAAVVAEFLYAPVEVGVGQGEAQLASLRTVEPYGRYGVAAHHVVASYLLNQSGVGIYNIGLGPEWVPAGVLAEIALEVKVGHFVAAGVVVEHAVEADGFFGDNWCAYYKFGLEGA